MASSWTASFHDSLPESATAATSHAAAASLPKPGMPSRNSATPSNIWPTNSFQQHQDFMPRNAQLEAIQLLMRANRQIYQSCPEDPHIERASALSAPPAHHPLTPPRLCDEARQLARLSLNLRLNAITTR